MRLSAIAANVFFIAYGAAGSFYPVLLLHVILLPLNVIRLIEQTRRADPASRMRPQDERSNLVEDWVSRRAHAALRAVERA